MAAQFPPANLTKVVDGVSLEGNGHEAETQEVMVAPIKKYVTPKGKTKQGIIDEFHKLYYMSGFEESLGWCRTEWLGIPMAKMPNDLLNLAELIWKVKPRLIIETGTDCGGSALFMATYLDMLSIGKVISVDIKPYDRAYPSHPRITYLGGKSSVDPEVVAEIKGYADYYGGPVVVILDSDHREPHVTKELEVFAPFVTPGSWLIVEDTDVNNHPVLEEHGPGPFEAVEKWLPNHPEFQEDKRIPSSHLFSMHSWFRRMRD